MENVHGHAGLSAWHIVGTQDKLFCVQCHACRIWLWRGMFMFACLVIFKCANCLFKWIVIIVWFQYFDTAYAYFFKRLLVNWAGSSGLKFCFLTERNGLEQSVSIHWAPSLCQHLLCASTYFKGAEGQGGRCRSKHMNSRWLRGM